MCTHLLLFLASFIDHFSHFAGSHTMPVFFILDHNWCESTRTNAVNALKGENTVPRRIARFDL
jgi:hypothetical protein